MNARSMTRLPACALVFLASFTTFPSTVGADVDERICRGRFALGLNYPGIGLKYFLFNRYALEPRSQFETGVFVPGARICRYFNPISGVLPYLGVEGAYASYKSEESKGVGYAGVVLAGGEYYVGQKFSFQFDFGPAYIMLADKEYEVDVSGIEYVINFGINYYLGSRSEKSQQPRASKPQSPPSRAEPPQVLPVTPEPKPVLPSEASIPEEPMLKVKEAPLPQTPTPPQAVAAETTPPPVPALPPDHVQQQAAADFPETPDDPSTKKLKEILQTEPNRSKAYERFGDWHYRNGDKNAAITAYERSLELNPENSDLKKWVEKVRAGVQPVAVEAPLPAPVPTQPPVPTEPKLNVEQEYDAAKDLYKAGDVDASSKKAKAILEVDPDNWKAWALLGNCHHSTGSTSAALDAYDHSLKLNPGDSRLRSWVQKLRTQTQPAGGG